MVLFPDWRLEAVWATGERRRFDMTPYLDYPAFAPLRDVGLFMRVRAAYGAVVWTDEIDVSPDTRYLRGERL